MPTFNTTKYIPCNPSKIHQMAQYIVDGFKKLGYEVSSKSEGRDQIISISKGGLFQSVVGLKTALNIYLSPSYNSIFFDARAGLFGHTAIPAILALLVTWPVVIPMIWGLIKQSQLDDKALSLAYQSVAINPLETRPRYCTQCGSILTPGENKCPNGCNGTN